MHVCLRERACVCVCVSKKEKEKKEEGEREEDALWRPGPPKRPVCLLRVCILAGAASLPEMKLARQVVRLVEAHGQRGLEALGK